MSEIFFNTKGGIFFFNCCILEVVGLSYLILQV